jgi:hypothetical protein
MLQWRGRDLDPTLADGRGGGGEGMPFLGVLLFDLMVWEKGNLGFEVVRGRVFGER